MDPKECRYNSEHWWVHTESPNAATMGLTPHAQWHLGDLLFIELSPAGTEVGQGEKLGEVEANKATLEVFAPFSLKIVEVNEDAVDDPKLINEDSYGEGWMLKAEVLEPGQLDSLMNYEEYDRIVEAMKAESEG